MLPVGFTKPHGHPCAGELLPRRFILTALLRLSLIHSYEELVPVHELYRYCEIAREMLKGEYGVGRVIARPFLGHTADTFYRTTNRHDLSLEPPRATMLDLLKDAGRDVIAVGKIFDIFDGEGVTEKIKTTGNTNGIAFTKALQTRDFEGLAFVNLVDFDMLYGHRRDVAGYALSLIHVLHVITVN